MKEKTQSEEYKLNENDEKMIAAMQRQLHLDLPEPPPQIDSFIKAAARRQLKKRKVSQNKQFMLWSCGIAATFAVSFSFLYFNGIQQPDAPVVTADNHSTAAAPAGGAAIALTEKEPAIQELAWEDVLTEISELSGEINEADLDVSIVAAYTAYDFAK